MSTAHPPFRAHQRTLRSLVAAIAQGEAGDVTDILAAVTPGGGKSLLPVIAAARLIAAGMVERVCWVVPRDSLRLQAEEAFADPAWRAALGHALSLRAADNAPDPSRGLAGYVTTYQGVAAAPDLHLREFRRHRTLLVVDEVHHLPALADTDPETAAEAAKPARTRRAPGRGRSCRCWSAPRCACCCRARWNARTGAGILWLPYRKGPKARTREIALDAPGWAVIGYSRAQALQERAVLPVTFGALDGEASWRAEEGVEVGPHRLAAPYPNETTRPALFTALRTGFAEALLRRGLRQPSATCGPGGGRSAASAPGEAAPGPGQAAGGRARPGEREALSRHRCARWMPAGAGRARGAAGDLGHAAGRTRPWPPSGCARSPSILVTVAMAYEGLDVPEVAVVAALTHIRSRPWLEQMVARATRVDPHAGPYADAARPGVPSRRPAVPALPASAWRPSRARWRARRKPAGRQAPAALLGGGRAGARRRTASSRSRATRSRCASPRCGRVRTWRCAPGAGGSAIGAARGAVGDRAAAAGRGSASWWRRRRSRTRRAAAGCARRRRTRPRITATTPC